MNKEILKICLIGIFLLQLSGMPAFASEDDSDFEKEIYMKFGNDLGNPPFELRKDYYEETGKSWRYLIFKERKKYFQDWLSKNPGFMKDQDKEEDPALENPPTKLQQKYGLYLENAPFEARSEFFNTRQKSWQDTGYLEKNEFLEEWVEMNLTKKAIEIENIPDDLVGILKEIHRKYGKDLYNAPFDARVEYFQTYNQSWRDIGYIERKNFILEWYQRNQEKLKKFKEQLKAELDAKFQNELQSMKMVDLKIPSTFGDALDRVPFEMKQQYNVDTGDSWGDASLEIREVYAKKWLIENEEVYNQEIERSQRVFQHKIDIIEDLKESKEERDKYREEIENRKKRREKEALRKKKEEQDRREAFHKRVEAQRKKLQRMIRNRDREKARRNNE